MEKRYEVGKEFTIERLIVNGEEIKVKGDTFTTDGIITDNMDANFNRNVSFFIETNETFEDKVKSGDLIDLVAKGTLYDSHESKEIEGTLSFYGEVVKENNGFNVSMRMRENDTTLWQIIINE